jgi:hypothetical protein
MLLSEPRYPRLEDSPDYKQQCATVGAGATYCRGAIYRTQRAAPHSALERVGANIMAGRDKSRPYVYTSPQNISTSHCRAGLKPAPTFANISAIGKIL